jgi:hypothetical protein
LSRPSSAIFGYESLHFCLLALVELKEVDGQLPKTQLRRFRAARRQQMERAPAFDWGDIPENERVVIGDAQSALERLGNLVAQLRSSYELVEHCRTLIPTPPAQFDGLEGLRKRAEASRKYRPWEEMAYRNGALVIYDFFQTVQIMNSFRKKSDWLQSITDDAILKESNVLFATHFPTFGEIRNAAAHDGENLVTRRGLEHNALRGGLDFQGFKIDTDLVGLSGTIINGHYTWTVDGKIVSYILNADTVRNLENVAKKRWKAFAAGDVEFRHRERREREGW